MTSWGSLRFAIFLLGSLYLSGTTWAETAPLKPAPADLELMEQILAESRVDTAVHRPSAGQYLAHLIRVFQESFVDLLARASNRLRDSEQILRWSGGILIAAAGLAVALGLGTLLRSRLGKERPPRETSRSAETSSPVPERWGAAAWHQEIDKRLAANNIPGALEAVWWWAARSLIGARADPSWTSKELTRRARRPELTPALRCLDSMIYGSATPSALRVRNLLADLEAQVS